VETGRVRPLGKLGSRLGPLIFRGRQFCIIYIEKNHFWKFINEVTLAYFLIPIHYRWKYNIVGVINYVLLSRVYIMSLKL